jgi:hypothetical protein
MGFMYLVSGANSSAANSAIFSKQDMTVVQNSRNVPVEAFSSI